MSDHTHTPPPGEVPGWVSEKELKAWEQRSRTKAGTAHYTFYRYDWSWIYARVIRPMENELSLLAGEIRDLQAENDELLSRIEALEENSGGTEFLPKGYTYQAEITVK